jgi:class 3 adenylate cyclase/tetratricopeptide (TPR) repeat protein
MTARKTTLDMFIPEDRRQALSRGENLQTRMQGAVLFADLSGFTRLTGIFSAELGQQRGAEALTQLLGPIYTELVNSIHNYRGSVIVISGDGITCWFERDDGHRATACAFVMQNIIARSESISISDGQKIGLGIKIAISVGIVQRFLVGNPNIQLVEAMVGGALDRVVFIHEALERGEVAVSRELLNNLESGLQVLSWRQTPEAGQFAVVAFKSGVAEPEPWPEIPALADEVARQWVHRSIYGRIEHEEIEFLTELRQAVPLFVRFTGIDFDEDEEAGKKLDQFIRCVQSVLERYEGYLCQLTIGGRGTNAFLAFGAPIAHEDNVDRALSAALKLREDTARLGFIEPIRIGLTRGPLWAGAHGGSAARTYSVMGSDVNLAHRLMSHAGPGQILVSPHVAETAPHYGFEALAPISLKGIEKPMTPFVLLGRTKAQTYSADRNLIFGRVTERGILTMKLVELTSGSQAGRAGTVLIEGEAGIGKSRLVTDLMDQARQRGVKVLYGEADPIENGTQYYAFRFILESIFNIADGEDAQVIRNRVLASIAGDRFLLERAPLLSEILPQHWPDNELTSQMSGEARALSIMDVMLGVLKNAQLVHERPVPTLIVLDDAQWLDHATWNLIGYLARQMPATLFVVSMRPFLAEEVAPQPVQAYHQLCDDPATQRLELSTLTLQDMAQLVEERLGVTALPMFVLEFIRMRSHGNPFFTEQTAYALRDAGIIRIENEQAVIDFAADELSRIDFPATVQGIITSRIDRLSPSQQLTLKVASVIGRVFLLKMLANVHPAKPGLNALEEQLSALNRLGITDLEAPTPELSYLFKHVITQEVIYSLLTFAQRKQLHCAIAEWYERNHVEDQSPYYSRLAHHWLRGEVVEKAIYFLDQAGQQALELYSNEDVVRFISTAIELDQQSSVKIGGSKSNSRSTLQRARWERMLGLAHLHLGHLPESLNHYAEALRLLESPMPKTNAMIVIQLIKEILIQFAHRVRGNPPRYRGPGENRHKEEELAHIDIESAVYYSQNVALLAWGMLRRLNLAERLELPDLMAEGYSNLLLMAGFTHNQRLINLYRRLTWEAVEQANRISTRIYALLRDGVSLFINGDWERADEQFDTGMKLADQIGDTRHLANIGGAYATSLFLQGKYQESLQIWKDMYQRTASKDRPQTLAWSLYGQGHYMLMFGKIQDAILNLETSLALLLKSASDKILSSSLYGALSLAYFRNGQPDRALEYALLHERNAAPPSTSSIISYYSALFDSLLGLYEGVNTSNVHLSGSGAAQLKQLVGRIPRSLNAMKNLPANKAGVWLYKGLHDRLEGKQREALTDWARSLEYARRFNQPYELARASYELGQYPGVETSTRQEYLSNACMLFEKLGTSYELDRARTALDKLTNASTD